MENASKALIIAGAILLAILLISLGIMIFNQASNTVSNSGMTEAEVTSFNNKFLKYEGRQKSAVVRALCQEVMASNSQNGNSERNVSVYNTSQVSSANRSTIVIEGTTGTTNNIDSNKTYTVKMNYGANGLIDSIFYY